MLTCSGNTQHYSSLKIANLEHPDVPSFEMANCIVVSPKSTRIPVAASVGRSVGNSSCETSSGENSQGTRENENEKQSVHTVIAVTPKNTVIYSGRELPYGTASTVSKRINSATVNPFISNKCIFAKEGSNGVDVCGRNNNGENNCKKAVLSSSCIGNNIDSSLPYHLPDDLHFSTPSSLISSSQSSSSLSTVATSSSSSTEKETIIGLASYRSKIPCAGNYFLSCMSPKGLHNQSSADGKNKVGVSSISVHYLLYR